MLRTRLAPCLALLAAATMAVAAAGPAPAASLLESNAGAVGTDGAGAATRAPECRAGGAEVRLRGIARPEEAKTYRELPVVVGGGTTRVEVGYSWRSNGAETNADKTVLDLGLWDSRGPRDPAGFRGWSGSRQGKVAQGMAPVWVQADSAERGYVPGPVVAGTWFVELGYGAVSSTGATWEVTVRCRNVPVGPAWVPDPVDPSFVARATPGWYRADLHLHAYHSNQRGPDPATMVRFARTAGLDVVPVTEYVTDAHWGTLGATQRANADLVIWPGREIITYFGHMIVLGETPHEVEYRQGYDGIDMRAIQAGTVAEGALFSVAHPTIFPGKLFEAFCRGCEFQLGDRIDWDKVDTMEVVTGPAAIDPATFDRPSPGAKRVANPFVGTAVKLWMAKLNEGHRITAVAGSDDKLGPDYGEAATMIGATELSRPALLAALRAGRVYVQALGQSSPRLALDARLAGSPASTPPATFGATLAGRQATVIVTVSAGKGQTLQVFQDGEARHTVPITSDPFTYTFTAGRDPGEGPLGTFWHVETHDDVTLTALGNPVFLADHAPAPHAYPAPATGLPANFAAAPAPATVRPLPTGRNTPWVLAVVALLVAAWAAFFLSDVRRRRVPR